MADLGRIHTHKRVNITLLTLNKNYLKQLRLSIRHSHDFFTIKHVIFIFLFDAPDVCFESTKMYDQSLYINLHIYWC